MIDGQGWERSNFAFCAGSRAICPLVSRYTPCALVLDLGCGELAFALAFGAWLVEANLCAVMEFGARALALPRDLATVGPTHARHITASAVTTSRMVSPLAITIRRAAERRNKFETVQQERSLRPNT